MGAGRTIMRLGAVGLKGSDLRGWPGRKGGWRGRLVGGAWKR